MSSSAINQSVFQAKIGSVQNDADSSAVYSAGVWSFKNSTALTSVTITDAGNVGIGTASPGAKVHVKTGTDQNLHIAYSGGAIGLFGVNDAINANIPVVFQGSELRFNRQGAEAMRIDASGNLLVGTTSTFDSGKICSDGASAAVPLACRVTPTTNSAQIYFRNGNGIVGSITTNGSATSFNPSSDERLKENIQPITNGLERVSKLKPVDYTWKSDGRLDNGFIAQDLLKEPEFEIRVNPIGKTEDGEEMFGVDYMKFVAVLTAAIQELSAKVDAQAAEIEALKAKP